MSTYRQLKQQIAELEKKATIAMKEEAKKAIETIKKQIAEFGLTAADLGLAIARRARARAAKGKKLVLKPKYREPITGKTWNGHGKRPGWIVAAQKKGTVDELVIAKGALAKASPQGKAYVKPKVKRTQTAPAAKRAAGKVPKKRTASAPKKRAAPKAMARKPVARKVAKPSQKPQTEGKSSVPAATEPMAVAS
jgi:DNA-binding protein H-NS